MYRRTPEGGPVRKPSSDAYSGILAISINEASRVYHNMPQHFLHDKRSALLDLLEQRGLPALEREPPVMANRRSRKIQKSGSPR